MCGHALLQRLGTVVTTVLSLVRNSTVIQHECMTPSCRFQHTVGFVGTPIIPSSSAFAAAFTPGTHAWCSAPKPCRMSFPTPPSRHNGRGAKKLVGNQEDPACSNENILFNFGNPPPTPPKKTLETQTSKACLFSCPWRHVETFKARGCFFRMFHVFLGRIKGGTWWKRVCLSWLHMEGAWNIQLDM